MARNPSWLRWRRVALRSLGSIYLVTMIASAGCVVWYHSIRSGEAGRSCLIVFLLAFFAGPSTALFHVWVSPMVKHKMRQTQRLTIGFGAYFEAYRYLMSGGDSNE